MTDHYTPSDGQKAHEEIDAFLSSMKRRRERAARKAKGPRPRPHTVRLVDVIPACDLCADKGLKVSAYAEAVLPAHGGAWANVCAECFGWCCCSLGLAKGQKYKLKREVK